MVRPGGFEPPTSAVVLGGEWCVLRVLNPWNFGVCCEWYELVSMAIGHQSGHQALPWGQRLLGCSLTMGGLVTHILLNSRLEGGTRVARATPHPLLWEGSPDIKHAWKILKKVLEKIEQKKNAS